MATLIRADPHVFPRGRDHERLDALEYRLVGDGVTCFVALREAAASADAPEAWPRRV
jgi:hypothetical protein